MPSQLNSQSKKVPKETKTHRLRSPLASLKATLYLLKRALEERGELSEEVHRHLNSLEQHADTLQQRITEEVTD
jgi:signal transduction histidine kinase